MEIIYENFNSLNNFIETMEHRDVNTAFKKDKNNLSSQVIKEDSFSGTYSYKSAVQLVETGYSEPLSELKKGILKIGRIEQQKNQRPRPKNDFVGFVPNVPNMLMNVPETMINRQRITPKNKTIHLIYGFTVSYTVKKESIIKAGINFISLVNSLEMQGYNVKIDILFSTMNPNKTINAAFTVNLKQYGQRLNLLKLSFPLIHPSMLRRFAFKWLETTPKLKDTSYRRGYGVVTVFTFNKDTRMETNFYKDKGIIKGNNSFYCNIYDSIHARDINDLADKIGITQYKKAAR